MASHTFTIEGDVNVEITITELADGTLQFDLKVLNDTGSIGDLNALFFDINELVDPSSLYVDSGEDVTGTAFKEDGVTKVDNFTNMNGEVIKEYDKFDGGVQFGSQGIAEDDIRETSFILASSDGDLTLADFNMSDFGIRLTSVGEEDGSRDGSLKLGGTMPEPEQEPEPVNTANTDYLTVFEDNFLFDPFTGEGGPDILDSGAMSVLANDTTDDGPYTGVVTAVGGDELNVAQIVAGTDGGSLIIYEDGTVDFSAINIVGDPLTLGQNEFADLDDGQTRTTTFDYSIEGGSTAELVVTVNGISTGFPEGPEGPGEGGGPIGIG